MKPFKDRKDRTWELDINCDTIEAIKAECGCNVLDLLDPESELAKEVSLFPPLIAKLVLAAMPDQAKTKDVTAQEFRRSMDGDCLDKAHDALLEEIVSFCPKHRRRVAAAVLEKNRDVQEATADLALARLADPTLKSQIMEALEINLRTEMQAALDRLNPRGPLTEAGAITFSPAVGTPPVSSDSPAPDLTPGESSAA